MNHHYGDIRSRISEPPKWFDEHAVPRWSAFGPRETANIYADQVAFVHIACQSCSRDFLVCFSWCWSDKALRGQAPLSERVRDLHYGDPPNVECCPAGPTMNSVPRRVVQFWRRDTPRDDWRRDPSLEIAIDCEWAEDAPRTTSARKDP